MRWRATDRFGNRQWLTLWWSVLVSLFCFVNVNERAWAEELVLIYTGNTQSFLEVCGCTDNQLGGIARRATLVKDLKRSHPNALVLDAGGLFAGDTALDRLRCRVHLRAMKEMAYDVANVGAGELRFGVAFYEAMRDSGGVPFVSANVLVNGDRIAVASREMRVGALRVGVLGVAEMPVAEGMGMMGAVPVNVPASVAVTLEGVRDVVEKMNDVDVVVLLSDLSHDLERGLLDDLSDVDVVIRARNHESHLETSPLRLGTQSQGKALGLAVLNVENGKVSARQVKPVFVSESIGEDRGVKKLVDGFYDQVENNPDLQKMGKPRFEGFALEDQVVAGANGYVGVETCAGCHPSEVADWEHSHHAGAFNRLLQKQKHYQPDCVTCHTTGFGYPTGFKIGRDVTHLTNVQCEVCHGPGGQHARRPEVQNIRKTPSAELCQRCHDENQTPDFDARFAEMIAEVGHKGYVNTHKRVEAQIADVGRDGKALVELFVMADCPYGVRAEQALSPVFRALGDEIDFRLHFIADEAGVEKTTASETATRSGPGCEATTTSGTGRFRSLHGDPEIAEGIRQTVVMAIYPDRYWDYILCRNEIGIGADWKVCAEKVGMDVAKIAEMAEGDEGEDLFAENIRRANVLGINASPTLLINGKEVEAFYDPSAVARLICKDEEQLALCDQVPQCRTDEDCAVDGKVGVCVDGNTPQARCEVHTPVSFGVTILNDADCTVCETYPFVRSTLALFPGADFKTVDVNTELGQELATRYGIDRLPGFVLDQAFEKTARFGRFAHIVQRVENGFVPDTRLTPVSQLTVGQPVKGMDLFLDADSPTSLGMAERLLRWVAEVDAPERLRLHFLGVGEVNEVLRRVQLVAPEHTAEVLICYLNGVYTGNLSLENCLDQIGVQLSQEDNRQASLAVAQALGIRAEMVPAVVIDGRYVVQANGLTQVEALFYRLHPDLALRDRNYVQDSGVK